MSPGPTLNYLHRESRCAILTPPFQGMAIYSDPEAIGLVYGEFMA